MPDPHQRLPKVIDLFDATPHQLQGWLAEALPSLSHEALDHLQQEYDRTIDRLYPDDPGSLLNRDYRAGQRLKAEMKQVITEAHRRRTLATVNYVEGVRNDVLGYQRGVISDGVYSARRGAIRLRQQDELAYGVKAAQATNIDLQEDLARQGAAHSEQKELLQLEANIAMRREQLTADLDRQRLGLTQPLELQKTLATLILAAWEKQERDPTFRTTFANLQELLGQASLTVTNLALGTDAAGRPLDEDARQQKYEEALAIVMEVARLLINRKL